MSQVMQLIFAVLFAILPECQGYEANCKGTANPYGYDVVYLDTAGPGVLVMKGEFHDGPGIPHKRDFPRARIVENTDH